MSEQPGAADGGPYPDPRSAFLLTVASVIATGFIGVFLVPLGAIVAIGVGQALAVGAIATFTAQRVPEPQAERLGLRGFDIRSLPIVLCLVPAILLASEIDNFAADASPTEDAQNEDATAESWADDYDRYVESEAEPEDPDRANESPTAETPPTPEEEILEQFRVDMDDPWTVAQAFVLSVGITPVVEEFFFRGVLQQSMVARLGLLRGVGFVAFLYAFTHLPAAATFPRFLAGIVSALGFGTLLGLVRVATGSILASILLASASAFVGIFSFAVRKNLPLPGMNVEGTHLPITVTLASLFVLIWAVRAVYEEAKQRHQAEHPDPPSPE